MTQPMATLVRQVQSDFDEMPELCLTLAQAVRFWSLDVKTCTEVFVCLLDTGFLVRTHDGRYRRARNMS